MKKNEIICLCNYIKDSIEFIDAEIRENIIASKGSFEYLDGHIECINQCTNNILSIVNELKELED